MCSCLWLKMEAMRLVAGLLESSNQRQWWLGSQSGDEDGINWIDVKYRLDV